MNHDSIRSAIKSLLAHARFTAPCCLITFTAAVAAPEQTSSVLDGSGGRSTAGALELVSAVGQPGGVSVSTGNGLVNYAGFLNTFSLRPTLDSDGDGLENEVDPDNDNDTLDDLAEVIGSGFNPVTATDPNDADSDHDGMSDGEEAAAETNPLDDTMYLHITGIAAGGDVSVRWQARHGKTYQVYRVGDLTAGLPGTHVDDITVNDPSALPPWYETEASFGHLGGGAPVGGAYYIKLRE